MTRMLLKLCCLAVAIFLTYHGGYVLGRKEGKAEHPGTFQNLVALITGVTADQTEVPLRADNPFDDPFGGFSGDNPFGDPFGGAN